MEFNCKYCKENFSSKVEMREHRRECKDNSKNEIIPPIESEDFIKFDKIFRHILSSEKIIKDFYIDNKTGFILKKFKTTNGYNFKFIGKMENETLKPLSENEIEEIKSLDLQDFL